MLRTEFNRDECEGASEATPTPLIALCSRGRCQAVMTSKLMQLELPKKGSDKNQDFVLINDCARCFGMTVSHLHVRIIFNVSLISFEPNART